ncbi:MAG TPA: nitrous oxide reductase family maturation protein NosD [Vicinamibacterales bacterium]|nr:nitrous oxide reductase family maturation protein NosD [Vicinamibacterales bacterium]
MAPPLATLLWLVAQSGVSPLQARVDAAPPASVVIVDAGTYEGDLTIDRPVRLVGRGRPRLVGSGAGTVVRITAPDVTLDGFDIDGRKGGSLANDSAGVHVSAPRATIRDCRVERSLFGIYVREANDVRLEGNTIAGLPGADPGDQGSGIHLFNTTGFTLIGNRVRESRDGIYLQSSSHGYIAGNVVTDVRYGLHYMYSDDNVFEDNRFERSAAGAALMYSTRIVLRRNQFVHNRGFASVGILLQACDEVLAEDNLIEDNARGVFLEGTHRDVFRRNAIATSDTAIVLYDSAVESRFEGNSFVGNLSPLQLIGRRTDTVFRGNYWSDADEPDLDGDGFRDRAYRLSNVFDHLRGNLTAADLFAQSLGAAVVSGAERAFPVLDAIPVEDPQPLVRPPVLRAVPVLPSDAARGQALELGASVVCVASGLAVLIAGGRRITAGRP